MRFEWDPEKEAINIHKHGVDFKTASLVFDDTSRIEFYDYAHSDTEDRYITIGQVNEVTYIVLVIYTERHEVIRLISARKATKEERSIYYDR